MLPVGLESAIPRINVSQTSALDGMATGIELWTNPPSPRTWCGVNVNRKEKIMELVKGCVFIIRLKQVGQVNFRMNLRPSVTPCLTVNEHILHSHEGLNTPRHTHVRVVSTG
jgi:hypothetical protein